MTTLMDHPEEVLDLVNECDEVVGTMRREEIPNLMASPGKGYTRAVGVFLVSREGKLWIPRRQRNKKIAPGGLDFSAGEHVLSGESYEAATVRGMSEELNIAADPSKLKLIGTIRPFGNLPYFQPIYLYPYDDTPSFNPDDFSDYAWLSPVELEQKLQGGKSFKDYLLPAVRLLTEREKAR